MKKYDNYKDSGIEWIGEIPEHWEVILFKRVIDKIKDGTHGSFQRVSVGHAFLSAKNVYDDGIRIGEIESYINEIDFLEITKNGFPKKNDLLITCVGTIGRTFVYDFEEPMAFQRSVTFIRFNYGINPQFYKYYVQSSIYQNLLTSLAKTSAQSGVYMNDIMNTTTLKLPIEEQTAIATYLDSKTILIDHLIAQKKQLIDLLQEERTAVINQAVIKGLDPTVKMKDSGIEWLGEIPEHWEVKRLKHVFNPSKGLTITKDNLKNEGIACVNYGEVHSKFGFELDTNINKLKCVDLSYLESDERSLLECGDFVFADTSEDIAGAGNFTYLKSEKKIFAGYHTIILKPVENLDSRFFAYEFDSIPFRTQIRQSVKGVKVFSITQAILKNVNIWFPPKIEQKAISDFLTIETDKIDSIIFKAKEEIELLKEYKTALISEVVTGKVDVRDVVFS